MMNRHCSVLLCVVPLLLLMAPNVASAQDAPPPPPADSNTSGQRSAPPRSVQVVANQLIQETGAKIFVVSALAQQMVVLPRTSAASPDTLEESLDTLVKRIPGGSWAKLYLPPSSSGRRYTGDSLAQMSAAELALFGRQTKAPAGTVVILGKQMTASEAEPYVHGLGLEPHYVIFSRRMLTSPMAFNSGGGGGGAQGNPIMDGLMKQLGVANMRDIPSGNYVVSIMDANGNPQKANVQVTNEAGRMGVKVSIDSTGGPPRP